MSNPPLAERKASNEYFETSDASVGSVDTPSTTGAGDHDITGSANTDESLTSIKEKITKKESQKVFRLRVLFVFVLVLTAGVVSYMVYRVTASAESEEFMIQYEAAAEKIIASFESIIHKMGYVSSLGVEYTTHGVNHGGSFPFMTLPNFQVLAGNARHMSGALFVGFTPVVSREHFDEWDQYVSSDANQWIDDAVAYQDRLGINDFQCEACYNITTVQKGRKVDLMHRFDQDGKAIREESPEGPYFPLWQTSPFVNTSGLVNHNIIYRPHASELVATVMSKETGIIGDILNGPAGNINSEHPRTALIAALQSIDLGCEVPYHGEPVAELFLPVFDSFNETERKVAGILSAIIQWETHLRNILPNSLNGIVAVIDYECEVDQNVLKHTYVNSIETAFTFRLDGTVAQFVGYGDRHEGFDEWMRQGTLITDNLDDGTVLGIGMDTKCSYDIHVFPSQEFQDTYVTSMPFVITASIAAVFAFTIATFILYDSFVERRQRHVLAKAMQSTAIVSSLFPKNVRDRLMESDDDGHLLLATKSKIKGFLNGDDKAHSATAAPIADLFPNCSVIFADIVGFTSWSSTREPAEVFILLQSLFQEFDALAKRRRVFKVETIGDCYMAATGLPEPQDKHALSMVRFAWDVLQASSLVTKQLESKLGPDTSELGLRIGIHSGPVTAGVLRGDRARFQLFGDTVNTAARMEATGCRGKIQISEVTAKLLLEAGRGHWLTPRKEAVEAKGKGLMKTYFANPSAARGSSVTSGESTSNSEAPLVQVDKSVHDSSQRLVDWVVDLFVRDIKKILHSRVHANPDQLASTGNLVYQPPEGQICLDEVKRAVHMPDYNASIAACRSNHDEILIDEEVMRQLRGFVATIAALYRSNPFHNFEHACHVIMSVKKILARVVAPELLPEQLEKLKKKEHQNDLACHLHQITYGIHSEPLALIALTFSALIHDVDHRGVSNAQMMEEEPAMTKLYRGKAIAEQNSLDLAWNLFMEDYFLELRRCLFLNEGELKQFRQLIVNIVLATDIFDKDLNGLRTSRWNEAFSDTKTDGFDNDLRATIVLEHIIQASDVSHTMQHWHVYQKWNRKLFREMSQAFKAGRMAKDPKTFWYRGELGFFDNYIIPLANRLKDCGVFGVSYDEFVSYAIQNRNEWKLRGEELVDSFVAEREAEEALERDGLSPRALRLSTATVLEQDPGKPPVCGKCSLSTTTEQIC